MCSRCIGIIGYGLIIADREEPGVVVGGGLACPFQNCPSLTPEPEINIYGFKFRPLQPLQSRRNLSTLLYRQRESLHGFTELLDRDRVIGHEQNSSNERG